MSAHPDWAFHDCLLVLFAGSCVFGLAFGALAFAGAFEVVALAFVV